MKQRIDMNEATLMADAIVNVLKTYDPQQPTLCMAAILLVAGRFMATQVAQGHAIEVAAADAFDVISSECIRVLERDRERGGH